MDRYVVRLLTWLLISVRHSPSVKITVDDMSCLLKETAQFTAALRCCCDNVMTDNNDMVIW